MFCRRVCQRLGPVFQRVFTPTFRKAPVRHMSFGVPGGSTNMTYFVLCGGGLTAAVVYAYKTVIGDSERYEDRLANMGSPIKADVSSAETVIAAAEPAPVEEPDVPVEVVLESASETAEPVADSTGETVVENTTLVEDVGVVSEVIATENEAEPTPVDEAPPVVAEAAPTPVEAMEETPAEASANAEAVPDLLTAVKLLTGSTIEIAAASVGESSLVRAVRYIEEEGKGSDSVLEVLQPEDLEETKDLASKEPSHEVVIVTNGEELDLAEVVSCDEEAVTEVKVSSEVTTEEVSSPAAEEEEEVPPEEAAPSGSTDEKSGGMHAEDQNSAPDPEENETPEEASPDESAEASIIAEASVDKELPGAETFGEDAAEAEAPAEETVTASEEEGTSQLPEVDTGSEMQVLSAAEPESDSHHDSPAEVMMPTLGQPSEILEDSEDKINESREAASPVETQSPEATVVMINQS